MLVYEVMPIGDRTGFGQPKEGSRFTSSWTSTLDLLEREIEMLRGRHVVFEIDVDYSMIRNDGMLRADAKPKTPAVRIAFESKHGPLQYATDRWVASSYVVSGSEEAPVSPPASPRWAW